MVIDSDVIINRLSLVAMQTHRDAAPVWLTLVHYVELLESKGLSCVCVY